MDPGRPPEQAGVLGVVSPASYHGAGSCSLPPTSKHGGELRRVDGTLARYQRGGNAIAKLGPSFNASLDSSLPPTPTHGGESRKVNGTLSHSSRGVNAITKLGPSFIAGSVSSLSTHHNGREGYCSRTPCRHDHLLLGLTHFSPSLVPATASEASPGFVSRRISVRRVGLG